MSSSEGGVIVPQHLIDAIDEAALPVINETIQRQKDFDARYFQTPEFDMDPGFVKAKVVTRGEAYEFVHVADSKYGPIVEMTLRTGDDEKVGLFVFAGSIYSDDEIRDLDFDIFSRLTVGLASIVQDPRKYIQQIDIMGEDLLKMHYTYRLCLGGNIVLLPLDTQVHEPDGIIEKEVLKDIPKETVIVHNTQEKVMYSIELNPVIVENRAEYIEVEDVMGDKFKANIT